MINPTMAGADVAPPLAPEDEAAIRAIVTGLAASWNTADGAGYGTAFTEDAEFVNVYGHHFHGRAVIAAGHQQIFDTVYRGSRIAGTVEGVRTIGPGVALAQVAYHLRIPRDGAEHEARARATLVLTNGGTGWQIAAFHNPPIAERDSAGPHGPRA